MTWYSDMYAKIIHLYVPVKGGGFMQKVKQYNAFQHTSVTCNNHIKQTYIYPGHSFQLTCLKSATKVIRVPSPCLNSTVMESFSLSASRSSSVICPSAKRTFTFSSEADPRVTVTVSSKTNTVNRTEPGEIHLANMPDNPKSQTPGSEGESTGITVADAVRLIPQVFR